MKTVSEQMELARKAQAIVNDYTQEQIDEKMCIRDRLGSCSTAGVVIGTASAGFLTDRFGRKRILLWGVFIFTFFTSVSYTHLDVYKRQVLPNLIALIGLSKIVSMALRDYDANNPR